MKEKWQKKTQSQNAESYSSRLWYTTFRVGSPVSPGSRRIRMSPFVRTRVRPVLSWPCAKTGRVRSRTARSRVRPWQLFRVVAYANRRGNWRRCTVQLARRGLNSKLIRGNRNTFSSEGEERLDVCSSSTRTTFRSNAVMRTLAFFTRPLSMHRFLIMQAILPTLRDSSWGGTPGSCSIERRSLSLAKGIWKEEESISLMTSWLRYVAMWPTLQLVRVNRSDEGEQGRKEVVTFFTRQVT